MKYQWKAVAYRSSHTRDQALPSSTFLLLFYLSSFSYSAQTELAGKCAAYLKKKTYMNIKFAC